MKLPLHLFNLTLLIAATPEIAAYSVSPSSHPHLSHFLSRSRPSPSLVRRSTQLKYKKVDDPLSNKNDETESSSSNVWTVLANTERWISDTLDRSNRAANARNKEIRKNEASPGGTSSERNVPPRSDNPYARKEVSYVCETGDDLAVVVGGIFRRVREAREMGESHGKAVDEQMKSRADSSFTPSTLRQTNVVVIPNCDEISKFQVFDRLIQAVNLARRKARDYVVSKDNASDKKEWVVSINCAHLHPQYGVQSPEEIIAAMKHEEEEGEVDVNLQEYKKRRDEARRSPYPSVIVEVQSTPPPNFGSSPPPQKAETKFPKMSAGDVDEDVTSEDVKKLEALFGMSAAKKSSDETFYDALGEAFGNKQLSATTPLNKAQNWVLDNDPAFDANTSTFTNSDTRHIDAAYEFVFNSVAMLSAQSAPKPGQKSYVVLPNFLPTSATSFDRFAGQVSNIISAIPSLENKVLVSTFHPEHVAKATRSPVPIFVICWK